MTKHSKECRLKPAEELFCQYYAKSGIAFGNARQAYALAYKKKFLTEKQKKVCDQLSWRLLGKVKVLKRCEELMSELVSDEIADSELDYVVKQRENLHAKVNAIGERNKLRGRITQKLRHRFEGIDTEALKQALADTIAGSGRDSRGAGNTEE